MKETRNRCGELIKQQINIEINANRENGTGNAEKLLVIIVTNNYIC